MLEEFIKNTISPDNVEYWFNYCLEELEEYLKRKPSIHPQKVFISKIDYLANFEFERFDFGVKRTSIQNKKINLQIHSDMQKIIKFILLRESFYLFIPIPLQNYSLLKTIVLVKVSDLLNRLPNFNEWENYFKTDPLYAWWKFRFGDFIIKNLKNLFDYIHKHSSLFLNLDVEYNLFRDIMTQNIIQGYFENEDELEFFSLIYGIFQITKRYTRRADFENVFKKLKLEQKINTSFTPKKFNRYFKTFLPQNVISPNYQINWQYYFCNMVYCYIFFNPQLGNYKVQKILQHLPFYWVNRTQESKFGVEVTGIFVIPMKYIDDLKKFFKTLINYGIIKKFFLLKFVFHENFLNLNYFKKNILNKKLLLRGDKDFNEHLIFSPSLKYTSKEEKVMDLFDIILLNRIRWFATTGFSFEEKWKQLQKVKSDVFSYLLTQKNIIKDLKKILNIFYEDPELKRKFLTLIDSNKNFGFFYIKEQISFFLKLIDLTEKILKTHPELKNEIMLFDFIEQNGIGPKFDENIEYNYSQFKKNLFNLFSVYFMNNSNFLHEKSEYENFLQLLKTSENLKIFNLKVIEAILTKKELAENIYTTKFQKIQKILKEYRLKKITFQDIDARLTQTVQSDPPGAVPFLITSISARKICPIFYTLLIKDSVTTEKKINSLKDIFPRVVINRSIDLISGEKYTFLYLYCIELNDNEKINLLGLIYKLFNHDLILFKQFIDSYIISIFSLENFFDVENNDFFYSKDFFGELSKFSISLIKDSKISSSLKEESIELTNFNTDLVKKISFETYSKNLKLKKEITLNLEISQEIEDLHNNLEEKLVKSDDLSNIIKHSKNIENIKFIPAYQKFGLENFYLYIKPSIPNEIEWKMLFPLGFKSIKYTCSLESANSYLFQYIFPSKNPNFSYLNWVLKSKREIDEYFSFSVKKIIPILNFNFNISPDGFYFGYQTFEIFVQKILFDKNFDPSIDCKVFNVSERDEKNIKGKFDQDFQNIIDLNGQNFLDMIKLRHKSRLNNIKDLINKKLIFPQIKLRENTGLKFKFYAIVPDLTREQIEIIIKIFNFLNYGFIYEIEGEYYFKEEDKMIKFENGLFLKFYLPDSAFNHFKKIITQLFNYFKIEHYLLFFDLVKGDLFVNNLFDKFKHPNPLDCHLWDKNIKKWLNHKSLTNKFEFIYPENQGSYNY